MPLCVCVRAPVERWRGRDEFCMRVCVCVCGCWMNLCLCECCKQQQCESVAVVLFLLDFGIKVVEGFSLLTV